MRKNKCVEFRFSLNELQSKVDELSDLENKRVILDSPTGSGKTEATLVALVNDIKEGVTKEIDWYLPTISSCIFMYRRFCKEFPELDVQCSTSIFKERRYGEGELKINIMTPDPKLIKWIGDSLNEVDSNPLPKNLVLDEFDSYPVMVRSAIIEYIRMNNSDIDQVIIPSATLDSELFDVLGSELGFTTVEYRRPNSVKYKFTELERGELSSAIKKDRRTVIILNSISSMNTVIDEIEYTVEGVEFRNDEDSKYIFLHSGLNLEERGIVERKIFENDYTILVSNDLVAYSIDFDADYGIVEFTDSWNTLIQRIGRFNRKCKRVTDVNLSLYHHGWLPPFVDYFGYDEVVSDFFSGLNGSQITEKYISDLKENFVEMEFRNFDEVYDYCRDLKDANLPLKLREVPFTFMVPVTTVVKNRKTGKKVEKETFELIKSPDIPWSSTPYSSKENREEGRKDLVRLNYGTLYRITNLNHSNEGVLRLEHYDGPVFGLLEFSANYEFQNGIVVTERDGQIMEVDISESTSEEDNFLRSFASYINYNASKYFTEDDILDFNSMSEYYYQYLELYRDVNQRDFVVEVFVKDEDHTCVFSRNITEDELKKIFSEVREKYFIEEVVVEEDEDEVFDIYDDDEDDE